MKQYRFEEGKLILYIKKSPIIGRIFLFLLAGIFLLMPFFWIGFALLTGESWSFGHIFGLILTCLIGIYALRLALWNSYGKEILIFKDQEIFYEVDYKWFKDAKKEMKYESLTFEIKPIGYLEDEKGLLVIRDLKNDQAENEIQSVVRMPTEQIEEVIGLIREL